MAGTNPGDVLRPGRCFSTNSVQVPIRGFYAALHDRGISDDGNPIESVVCATFSRRSARVEAWLVIENDILVGVIASAPYGRGITLQNNEQLLSDIETTLRELGWKEPPPKPPEPPRAWSWPFKWSDETK